MKFIKIRPVRGDLFHADGRTGCWKDSRRDGQTDMAKLIVASYNKTNYMH